MAAFGRLWRRAPAWRVCVITAVAFGGLAAMFPPALPRLPTWSHGSGATDDAASFHPTAVKGSGSADSGSSGRLIPDGPIVSGVTELAGHDVPLPEGSWRTIGLARVNGDEPTQINMLVRVQNGHLTGLAQLVAPVVLSGAVGPVGEPLPCADPGRLAGGDLPAPAGAGPLVHTCWAAVSLDMKALAARGPEDPLSRTMALLGDQRVRVANAMLAINLYVSNEHGWELLQVMIPDNGGTMGRIRIWANGFLPVVRQAFDHGLDAAAYNTALARDPGYNSAG